jgi:hypothetical protein
VQIRSILLPGIQESASASSVPPAQEASSPSSAPTPHG